MVGFAAGRSYPQPLTGKQHLLRFGDLLAIGEGLLRDVREIGGKLQDHGLFEGGNAWLELFEPVVGRPEVEELLGVTRAHSDGCLK